MHKYILKILASTLCSILFVVSSFTTVFAVDASPSPLPSLLPSPTPVSQFNSFEVFWPMVAGKTKEDKLYVLKRLKEKVRGALIFGVPQKTDYAVLLANKRLLETEKLLENKKDDILVKTQWSMQNELKRASVGIKEIKEKKILNQIDSATFGRVAKMREFISFLMLKAQGNASNELKNSSALLDEISSALNN